MGKFRTDIEGLRAVALLVIVAYHCGLPPRSGFVAVEWFFVISGFLITGLLLRDADERDGRLSLQTFYARRARRIVPAATFAVIVTIVAAGLWPQIRWVQDTIAADGRAAAAFVANFELAELDHGYFAPRPSVFRHFWTLAVEEQFYLLWPLVALVGLGATRNRRRLLAFVVVGGAVSLFLCVRYTPGYQSWAFYLLPTRAWELGAGALLAIGARHIDSVPQAWRSAGAVIGVGLMVFASLVTPHEAFPGSWAIVPVVGATLVLAAGGVGVVARVLSLPPLPLIGRYSYSLYLMHWPVLVLAASREPDGTLPPGKAMLLMLVVAVPLAVFSYHVVEAPIRFGRRFQAPRAAGAVAVTGVVLGVVVATLLPVVRSASESTGRVAKAAPVGSLHPTPFVPKNLEPTITAAVRFHSNDAPWPTRQPWTCEELYCSFGSATPSATIAITGDSHAVHWLGALYEAARVNDWRVVDLTKAGCPSWRTSREESDSGCPFFRAEALRRIERDKFDLVVVSNAPRRDLPLGIGRLRAAAQESLAAIRRSAPVVLLGDTPAARGSVPLCLVRHLEDSARCEPRRREAVRDEINGMLQGLANEVDASFVDPTDWLCSATRCPVVVGNQLVYFDDDHVTPYFSRTRGPFMGDVIRAALAGRA